MRVLAWPSTSPADGNPYIDLLYAPVRDAGVMVEQFTARKVLRGGYAVVHLHWPDWTLRRQSARRGLARVLGLLGLLTIARARGAVVVWTVHNTWPHDYEGKYLARLLYRGLRSLVAVQIHHNRRTAASMRAADHPALPARTVHIPLGPLPPARADLGPSDTPPPGRQPGERVIGMVGSLSAYKGVEELLAVFVASREPTWRLLLAGQPGDDDIRRSLLTAARVDARIHALPRTLSAAEFAHWLAALDLAVLPYTRVTNSGSLMTTSAVGIPVLVPALEELEDAIEDSRPFVVTYEGSLSAEKIRSALAEVAALAPRMASDPGDVWREISAATLACYRSALERQGRKPL